MEHGFAGLQLCMHCGFRYMARDCGFHVPWVTFHHGLWQQIMVFVIRGYAGVIVSEIHGHAWDYIRMESSRANFRFAIEPLDLMLTSTCIR
jgi:hypothetical protein